MSDAQDPGWLPDPTGRHDYRYWDGSAWSDHVSDAGVIDEDAYEPGTPDASTGADLTGTPAPTGAIPAEPDPEPDPEPQLDPEPEPSVSDTLTWDPTARPADLPARAVTPPPTPTPEPAPESTPASEPGVPSPTGWAASTHPTPDEVVDALTGSAEPTPPPTPAPPVVLRPEPSGSSPTASEPATSYLPPPVPPAGAAPSAAADGPAGGSSRKGLFLVLGALFVLIMLVGGALVLSGGDSAEEQATDDVIGWIRLQDRSTSDDDVRCLAKEIVGEVGPRVIDRGDFTQRVPLSGEDGAKLIAAYAAGVEECGIEAAQLDGGNDSEVGGGIDGPGSETLTLDEQTAQYEDLYDLEADQARCLAEADTEVRARAERGEVVPVEELLEYIDACDVPREKLGVDGFDSSSTTAAP